MAETTGIQWCDSTFNPWIGCVKVGPGCDHCYAETLMKRFGRDLWGQDKKPERTKTWGQPRKWQREQAEFFAEHGRQRRVFAGSLCDPFDNRVPQGWRDDYFLLIRECPDLIFIILTKRIGNAAKMMPRGLHNVWLLATIVTQAEADRDVPKIISIPVGVIGLSMEPLLEPVVVPRAEYLDWIIVGGESGSGARDMNPDWARKIRVQCAEGETAFFFKQMAHKAQIPDDLMIREFPNGP